MSHCCCSSPGTHGQEAPNGTGDRVGPELCPPCVGAKEKGSKTWEMPPEGGRKACEEREQSCDPWPLLRKVEERRENSTGRAQEERGDPWGSSEIFRRAACGAETLWGDPNPSRQPVPHGLCPFALVL